MRMGAAPEVVLDMAGVTDAQAEIALGVIDEVNAEFEAAELADRVHGIAGRLRAGGFM